MEPHETFDFLTAIKYLLEGKRVCGKDWIDSYLTINKDTKGVYNEHEQRLDVMQFMNINKWILLDNDDVSEPEPYIINTDSDQSYFCCMPDYNDILIDEFTSYTTDFEGWSIPNYYNWVFKLTNSYCPHVGDTIVYADVANCYKEQHTLDLCPVGVITKYNDYVVFVKFSNKEEIVELSREELKQLCYILLNEEHIPSSVTTIYNNETNKPYTLHLKTTSDIDYYDVIGNVIDDYDNRTDITIVDLFMNYHWGDKLAKPEFDTNEFKKALAKDEEVSTIDEIFEANDTFYASIPYGKVMPKEGDFVVLKSEHNYNNRAMICSTDTKNVFIINDYSKPVESIPMDEFIARYDKVIKDAMPALVSRHGNLGVNDKIYYEYVTGQKESFIILSVGISGFATKGITIQREEDPNDIYEISLINLHRLFTWRI